MLPEFAKDAAEVARVEVQLAGQLGSGGVCAVRQLVEHSHFGERVGALEIAVLQHADAAGIQAIEAANGVNTLLELGDVSGGHDWRDS